MTFRRVFTLCALAVAVFGWLAIKVWGAVRVLPHSVGGWAVLIGLGVPVVLLIEAFGEEALRPSLFDRWSSPMRIVVAVPLVLAILAVTLALVWGVRSLIAIA